MFGTLEFLFTLCAFLMSSCHSEPGNQTRNTHFLDYPLTENTAEWAYSIQPLCTVPESQVEDFKCYLSYSSMNCSWIPNQFPPLSLSYRECNTTSNLTNITTCYNSGQRRVCLQNGKFLQKDWCMIAFNNSSVSTFKIKKYVKLSSLNITENGTELHLSLELLNLTIDCILFNICYSYCNGDQKCVEYSPKGTPKMISYDKRCQYKFQYSVLEKNAYCSNIKSDSYAFTYGSTDHTLTVVAIVIPIIVSACVILSCVCLRRHKDIICPEIPDPSMLFKEMVNDNKENKAKMPMYTPVQEPVEPINIVPDIPRNS